MPVLPVAAIFTAFGSADLLALICTCFTVWAVGGRLLPAGLRQVAQPRFTAETLLGSTDPAAVILVRERGLANLALGALGVLSMAVPAWAVPAWALPAAFAGGILLAFAGTGHPRCPGRTPDQTTAMVTNLFAAAVLAGFVLATVLGCGSVM